MRRDFSIPQRAEDRWQDMHRSAQEQRLLKQVAQAPSTGEQLRTSLAARFLTVIRGVSRAASRMTRRAEG